ncbi:hypothetical protein A2Y99_00540 [Candidatus Gottesmanbacteria bacterium RBG_13_37_7]|uniref:asparaginase n=1 Tax=Candidatus Gottesmanbacteria bacterium RBG_13_37_7 TaxID=1798369 RepID=A0A1F5YI46_9BACT|nr:MAG: hypothetical protein A2Y99_00540 [Candidatus Gottesmanbacteria bacterium RBG_13_37_7]
MKKILILFCGGTITMRKNKIGALVPFYDSNELLTKYPDLKKVAKITIKKVVNIDSTNIEPKIWTKIATEIRNVYHLFDGFIVTHGTDTMAYTASALSFALRNLNKPVILTGSQKPPDDLTSDAYNNMINAAIIATKKIPYVLIVFGSKILLGNRATKVSESRLNAFDSPMQHEIGEIALEPIINITPAKINENKHLEFKPNFDPRILVINIHPGLDSLLLNQIINMNFNGIILKSYGPGNIPRVVIPFIKKLKEKKLPVVILSQCYRGTTQMQLYEVGQQALTAGAIPGGDMTIEAATTKLMWTLSYTKDLEKIKKIITKNLTGELTI